MCSTFLVHDAASKFQVSVGDGTMGIGVGYELVLEIKVPATLLDEGGRGLCGDHADQGAAPSESVSSMSETTHHLCHDQRHHVCHE